MMKYNIKELTNKSTKKMFAMSQGRQARWEISLSQNTSHHTQFSEKKVHKREIYESIFQLYMHVIYMHLSNQEDIEKLRGKTRHMDAWVHTSH